ncbi:vacuolar protein sorting-associated protein 8 homolog [Clytia hemisphaerica]|uniref:RING-type domain-containing protein n=1 Tax=Clytia hemisphaerica TaxID=252671 RepID=A0A7M5XLJ2_9CNID
MAESVEEFNFPDIGEGDLPSLESILTEDDSSVYQFEEIDAPSQGLESRLDDSDGNISLASVALPNAKANLSDLLKTKRPTIHGSILRHVILKRLSSQMLDACNRRDAGLPTSMAVSTLVAIGTSHGLTLVFEPKHQVLKLLLGSSKDGEKYGAVTALSINVDCDRLLCGYARGQVTMWDLSKGQCLRVITDAHPLGHAVLHIQFTDDRTMAMLNDSSGSVYTLSFKRALTRTCESSCFFSGSKGEVCTMVPLHISPNLKDSPLYGSSLLAMASLTKVIVVNMKPKPVPVFTQKLSGPENTLPHLSWHFMLAEVEPNGKQVVPVLALARHQTIQFFKVVKVEESFVFTPTLKMMLDYTLISMHWLNSQTIITIDALERIHTIDIKTQEELECLDLASVQLVYGSSYFKSLSTGGNVSEALKRASVQVCYQSVQCFSGQLLILGTKSVHCLTLRHWQDRLEFFVKRNEFLEALKLAELFYTDKGKAVVGLTNNKEQRRSVVAEEIVNILLSYIDIAMTVNCPKTHDDGILAPYFRALVAPSINYCLLINDLDLLFTAVYERFSDDAVAKRGFLEGLEMYILDSKIKFLTPVVMQDLIEHYESTDQVDKIQACFVHLDLSTVDIDNLVRLCWAHKLYDLVIYVFNKGLRDYLTPLEKLIKILHDALQNTDGPLSFVDNQLGCTILVYLSCCLAGNQYPIGQIDANLVQEVKSDIFTSIIIKRSEHADFHETYPHVRTLLLFDTREFLNVLSIAFEEKEFEPESEAVAVGALSKRQKIVDVLLQVMVNNPAFSPSLVGALFTFIARQMAKHEGSIHVNKLLFEQVLEYLTNPDEEKRHEEREQALLELLAAGGLKQFPDEQVLALSESAKFYRVCEIIYKKKRQHGKVLSCYSRDPARRLQIFEYIDQTLVDDSFTDLEREEFSAAVLEVTNDLVLINSLKFARLIMKHFTEMTNKVVHGLKDQPEIQYTFLKGVFEAKSGYSKDDAKKVAKRAKIDHDVHERFIELMCFYEPERVLRYLQNSDTYRLEQALAIVQANKIVHAAAYLLERMGDVESAFKLLHDDLQENVDKLSRCFKELPDENEVSDELETILSQTRKAMQEVLRLCLRNSQRLESEDREALWFPLLETVMAPQRTIKNTSSSHFLVFKEFTKEVLNNMMSFISMPAVLEKIMQDPTYKSGKFGEIKELILGMLETYNYELTLLETTKKILGRDLHGQYKRQKQFLSRGFQPATSKCELCFRSTNTTENLTSLSASNNRSEIIFFRCGHIFHKSCLEGSIGFEEEPVCVLCNKSNVMRTVTYRRTNSRGNSNSKDLKSGKNKKPGKKADFFVNLSTEQEKGLCNLWNDTNKAAKNALFKELVNGSSSSHRQRSGNIFDKRTSSTGSRGDLRDDKFSLKLAPPPLHNR